VDDGGGMRRDFVDRDDLVAYVREQFPAAAARDDHVAATHGGRVAAVAALARIEPARYGSTRNRLTGAVTRPSPYVRHGVVSLAELREAALARVRSPQAVAKLVQELAWRDYYQRLYAEIGDGIWRDREPPKTGFEPDAYAADLPVDIVEGRTGLVCMDAFSQELAETGYLHTQPRPDVGGRLRRPLAAGALAGGREVVSAASARRRPGQQQPLLAMGREHLQPQTLHLQSRQPRALHRRHLLSALPALWSLRLRRFVRRDRPASFPKPFAPRGRGSGAGGSRRRTRGGRRRRPKNERVVVWVHADHLGPRNPALLAHPEAPAIFVFDDVVLEGYRITLKRLVFLYECLLELPVEIARGDVTERVLGFARRHGATRVATTWTLAPRFVALATAIATETRVEVLQPRPFVDLSGPVDLGRFARYWRKAERQAFLQSEDPTPEPVTTLTLPFTET